MCAISGLHQHSEEYINYFTESKLTLIMTKTGLGRKKQVNFGGNRNPVPVLVCICVFRTSRPRLFDTRDIFGFDHHLDCNADSGTWTDAGEPASLAS